jgi:hypothetical protein
MSVAKRLLDRLALPALLAAAGLSMADRPAFCAEALLEHVSRVVAPQSAAVVGRRRARARRVGAPAHRDRAPRARHAGAAFGGAHGVRRAAVPRASSRRAADLSRAPAHGATARGRGAAPDAQLPRHPIGDVHEPWHDLPVHEVDADQQLHEQRRAVTLPDQLQHARLVERAVAVGRARGLRRLGADEAGSWPPVVIPTPEIPFGLLWNVHRKVPLASSRRRLVSCSSPSSCTSSPPPGAHGSQKGNPNGTDVTRRRRMSAPSPDAARSGADDGVRGALGASAQAASRVARAATAVNWRMAANLGRAWRV